MVWSGVLGFLMGSVTVTLLQALLPAAAMESYGWRIPFLIAGPLGLVGLYIRLRLADTPQFTELRNTDQTADTPLREALPTTWRQILQVIGMMIVFNIGYYVVFTFLPNYFISTLNFSKTDAFLSVTLASLVALVLILPLAALSDRIGRRPLLIGGAVSFVVLGYPLFLLMNSGSLTAAVTAHAGGGRGRAPLGWTPDDRPTEGRELTDEGPSVALRHRRGRRPGAAPAARRR